MAKMLWDQVGEKYYETGVKEAALFVMNNSVYGTGVPWNGLTKAGESPEGADNTDLWANDAKYASFRSAEKYGGTIEAYTYPDEFAQCDGSVSIIPGFKIGQQTRKIFGFVYKTSVGNDTDGLDKGYKIHIVYGATCSPSSKDYETINDSPDAIKFSWSFETTPVAVTGHKPTSYLEFDSTKIPASKMQALEEIIYGTPSSDPRLPLPDEIITLMTTGVRAYAVKLNAVGGVVTAGHDVTSYVTGTEVTLPTADYVTKEGYTFAGWVSVEDVTTTVTKIADDDEGDKEFIATWTASA